MKVVNLLSSRQVRNQRLVTKKIAPPSWEIPENLCEQIVKDHCQYWCIIIKRFIKLKKI